MTINVLKLNDIEKLNLILLFNFDYSSLRFRLNFFPSILKRIGDYKWVTLNLWWLDLQTDKQTKEYI